MQAHLVKILYAEAAHRNPLGGPTQQRLHGHSYKIEVLAGGPVNPQLGWVVDYAELKELFQPLYSQLDHGFLNEIPGLEHDTTLGAVKCWIEAHILPSPPWFEGVRVSIMGDLAFRPVRLPEDPFHRLPPRIRFSFEAAQSLPQLPEGHPCRHMHGHSYQVEVSSDRLDTLEDHLAALYAVLDHRCLNDIKGLGHATCERICRWIGTWLDARGHAPTVIVVQETPSAACIYRGE